MPTCAEVLDHLRLTGTGARKLVLLQQWLEANPDANSETMLRWAEDQHAADPQTFGEGTVHKIGLQVEGDGYGVRRANETNSAQNKRLQEKVNELERRLTIAESAHGHRATMAGIDQAQILALQEENMALKRQIQILSAPSGEPRGRGRRKPQPVAAGVSEESGQLAAVE